MSDQYIFGMFTADDEFEPKELMEMDSNDPVGARELFTYLDDEYKKHDFIVKLIQVVATL